MPSMSSFVRDMPIFGKHFETEIFGFKMHAYVYVDKDNALEGAREYHLNHEEGLPEHD
jgi:hypothetical protein